MLFPEILNAKSSNFFKCLNFICLYASFLLLDFGLYMTFQFFNEKTLFKKFPQQKRCLQCVPPYTPVFPFFNLSL